MMIYLLLTIVVFLLSGAFGYWLKEDEIKRQIKELGTFEIDDHIYDVKKIR
jgi:uncharacterized protein YneF (UPF0154 family)